MKKNRKINILFLSYGEDIFSNPILQNQFIHFCENFNQEIFTIHVYSFIPISRKRIFNNTQWNQDKIDLQVKLSHKNIYFKISTLPALANWLYSSFWQFLFFHTPLQYIYLAYYIHRHQIDCISARSYHAAFIALKVRNFFRFPTQIHFDPRSLFVEEGQLLKKITGLSLYLWNHVQRYIYNNSDIVTFVSEPFLRLQNQKYKIKKSLLMYTHVDLKLIKFTDKKSLQPLKFCYLGQIDIKGWHQIKNLFDLFEVIQKALPESELKIITKSNPKPIRDEQFKRKINNIEILTSRSQDETSKMMTDCHFGILSYKNILTPLEATIAQTVVGSKSGEYLAAGLPIICHAGISGISSLVRKHELGVLYTPGHENEVTEWIRSHLKNYTLLSKSCRSSAEQLFSLSRNISLLQNELEKLCVPS